MNTTAANLLALEGMPAAEMVSLLDRAEALMPVVRGEQPSRTELAGRIVANLFLEDSTRTRCSFGVAIRRLGGQVLDLVGSTSSSSKGESLVDTAANVAAMGVDAIVLRTSCSGGAALVAESISCPVINAGDGKHEHPTQGLLDALTLRRHLHDLSGTRIAIVGDIAGSRVARSNLHALTTLGASVVLVGPPALVPASLVQIAGDSHAGSITIRHTLDPLLGELDAIMMLRVQFERGSRISTDYPELYGLTEERAAKLRSGVPVLHPGPMNRGLEIDSAVADGPASVILEQVTGGVAVRMAVLEQILR